MLKHIKITSHSSQEQIDSEAISSALAFISLEGHAFISMNTTVFGSNNDNFRTDIIYRENQTRKVLFEKSDN